MKKQLYIIRHAKSDWSYKNLSDFERPINQRGKLNAPYTANILKQKGVMPDLVISSPAVRALTTAEIISKEIGYPVDQIDQQHRVYNAHVDTLLDLVHKLDDKYQSVMIFGHNPGMTFLASFLCREETERLPTCSVMALEFDVESWFAITEHSGECLFFECPPHDV